MISDSAHSYQLGYEKGLKKGKENERQKAIEEAKDLIDKYNVGSDFPFEVRIVNVVDFAKELNKLKGQP